MTDTANVHIMLEIDASAIGSPVDLDEVDRRFAPVGFEVDTGYEPVTMSASGSTGGVRSVIVRGRVTDRNAVERLRSHAGVVGVWTDTPIAPFREDPPP